MSSEKGPRDQLLAVTCDSVKGNEIDLNKTLSMLLRRQLNSTAPESYVFNKIYVSIM